MVEDRENEQSRELRKIVHRRRLSVFEHLDEQFQLDRLSEVVFDLLVHLALNSDVELSSEVVDSYLWRYELDDEKTFLQMRDGRRLRLFQLLEERHVISSIEMVNALLCQGFARKLQPLPPSDRQTYCQRIVGLLPGLERVGPYVLTDYLDLALASDDSKYFWQLYTERISSEVSKRGTIGDRDYVPWVLHHLLNIDEKPELIEGGGARKTLYRHLDRILMRERDRERCVRQFINGCEDDLTLRRLALSAVFVEDAELLAELITKGEESHISVALYAMQVHGELDRAVALILESFREQSLPDVSHRMTEVFAQLNIPHQPSRNLQRLILGIQTIVLDKIIGGESVEALAQAIAPDERSFRHCMLVASLATSERFRQHPSCIALLDRVLTTFLQSFSPYGTLHVLNTDAYRRIVRQAVYVLLAQGGQKYRERFEDFGLDIESLVARWLGPEVDAAERDGLYQTMVSHLLSALLPSARQLCLENNTREQGLALYRLLLRLYVEHRNLLQDPKVFGAIPSVVEHVFSDLVGRDFDEVELGYLVDAAHTVARVEQGFGVPEQAFFNESIGRQLDGGHVAVQTGQPEEVSAPVVIEQRQMSAAQSVLRAYSGLTFFSELKRGLLGFLGLKRRGRMTLTSREVIVSSVVKLGERVLERTGDSHSVNDLQSVRVVQSLRVFYLAFSLLSLICGGLIGGHFLFVGLRGGDTTLSIVGALILLLAVALDVASSSVMTRNQSNVRLELTFKTSPQRICASIDTQTGAALLDAFLANDAQRRELELLDGWNAVAAASIGSAGEQQQQETEREPIF